MLATVWVSRWRVLIGLSRHGVVELAARRPQHARLGELGKEVVDVAVGVEAPVLDQHHRQLVSAARELANRVLDENAEGRAHSSGVAARAS